MSIVGPGTELFYDVETGYSFPQNPGNARRIAKPDIGEEYLAGGFLGYGDPEVALNKIDDDLKRMRGPRVYDIISQDAKVGSALSVLPQAALQEGVTYHKCDDHKLKPDETDDPEDAEIEQSKSDKASEIDNVKRKPKKKLIDPARKQKLDDAQWALDFVEYNHNRSVFYGRSIEEWVYEMILEGLKQGSHISERVYEYQIDGPYPDMAVHLRESTKNRAIWAYVVDHQYNLIGILGSTDNLGEAILLPPEKFSIFSWNPANGDPRGRSHLRTVWQPYFHKTQTWAEWFKFMQQCSSARTVGILPEDEDSVIDGTTSSDATSSFANDTTLSPTNIPTLPGVKFRKSLEVFHNGRVIVIPNGADVKTLDPSGNGEAFFRSIESCNNEIATGIHNNPQITVETKRAGAASTGQAMDLGYLLFCYVAHCGAQLVRKKWFDLIAYNKGVAFAEEFTPHVTLINNKNIDWTTAADAVAKLFQVNFFTKKQMPEIDRQFGITEREPGDEPAGPIIPQGPQTTSPIGPGSGRQVPPPKPEPKPGKPANSD